MNAFWWAMLLIAGGILLYTILKPRLSVGMFVRFITNLALAAVVVSIVHITGVLGAVEISVNIPTILVAGLLGLPGVALIYGIHLFVLN